MKSLADKSSTPLTDLLKIFLMLKESIDICLLGENYTNLTLYSQVKYYHIIIFQIRKGSIVVTPEASYE
jgi:hypothetical protein